MTTAPPMPGLEQLAAQFQGTPGLVEARAGASVEVILGRLADHFDWTRKQAQRAAQAAFVAPFPAQVYTVTAGAPGVPTFVADAIAPKDGYVWFATRLSVDGLVPGTGSQAYAEGSVTTPAAAATIVQITAAGLAPGNYNLYVNLSLSGTLATGTDSNNMQLLFPGSGGAHPLVFPGQAGEYTYGPIFVNVPAGNGTALKISAIGLATTGAVYAASLDLVPVPADQVQLYRGPALAVAVQPQNRIHSFTAAGSPGPGPDWSPGGRGLQMTHQEALVLGGAGLSAAQLVLSGDVLCLEQWVVSRYLAGLG